MPTDFVHSLEFLQQLRSLGGGGREEEKFKVGCTRGALLLFKVIVVQVLKSNHLLCHYSRHAPMIQ
jgi:hypothetical protein